MVKIIASLIVCLVIGYAGNAFSQDLGMPCADAKIQAKRSAELQQIRADDQHDRAWQMKGEQPSETMLIKMGKNDLRHRMRVGEIFGEGCLKSAADYEAAFMAYQHGNTPDQYFQAFIWSRQAQSLGIPNMKGEIAMAIDRYLVSAGHKQLFGTQATKPSDDCWCIQPIEETFSESMRDEYRGGINAAYTGLPYLKILNANSKCPTAYCETSLMPSPRGTVVGFW
ncbi:MAG: hypothetical protein EOP04_22185 [Proteobacteria bacterium]|nr:MAG: hypothetical protein EOP04_22185 [Pseudomonadota bacterium]